MYAAFEIPATAVCRLVIEFGVMAAPRLIGGASADPACRRRRGAVTCACAEQVEASWWRRVAAQVPQRMVGCAQAWCAAVNALPRRASTLFYAPLSRDSSTRAAPYLRFDSARLSRVSRASTMRKHEIIFSICPDTPRARFSVLQTAKALRGHALCARALCAMRGVLRRQQRVLYVGAALRREAYAIMEERLWGGFMSRGTRGA